MKRQLAIQLSFEDLLELLDEKVDVDLREGFISSVYVDMARDRIVVKMVHPDGHQVPRLGELPIRSFDEWIARPIR